MVVYTASSGRPSLSLSSCAVSRRHDPTNPSPLSGDRAPADGPGRPPPRAAAHRGLRLRLYVLLAWPCVSCSSFRPDPTQSIHTRTHGWAWMDRRGRPPQALRPRGGGPAALDEPALGGAAQGAQDEDPLLLRRGKGPLWWLARLGWTGGTLLLSCRGVVCRRREHCLKSSPSLSSHTHQPTERAYIYKAGAGGRIDVIDTSINDPRRNVSDGVFMGEGDGTVSLLSLGYHCAKVRGRVRRRSMRLTD